MPKSSQRKSKKVNKTTTKNLINKNKNKKRSNRNKRSKSQRGGLGDESVNFLLNDICLEACKIMTPMVRKFYIATNIKNSPYKTTKDDNSIFTIADGMVQYLLKEILFKDKFMGIVGEESVDVEININNEESKNKSDSFSPHMSNWKIPCDIGDPSKNLYGCLTPLLHKSLLSEIAA